MSEEYIGGQWFVKSDILFCIHGPCPAFLPIFMTKVPILDLAKSFEAR